MSSKNRKHPAHATQSVQPIQAAAPDNAEPAPPSGLGLERLVFFSDAVMAIAITLLAIDLRVPDIAYSVAATELPARLNALTPRFISFMVSFIVVGIYWMSHHRYFGYIRRSDNRLILLNMVFLFFIACMPFVSSLLGQYGSLPIGVIAYALAVAGTGLSISAVWWYASHQHRLIDATLDAQYIRTRNRVALAVPAVFLLSIPVALYSPVLGMAVWWLSPLLSALLAWRPGRKRVV
jgi:uncharacterized membrane protein